MTRMFSVLLTCFVVFGLTVPASAGFISNPSSTGVNSGDATDLTGLLVGNGTTISAYGGTSCTNQFPRSLDASGAATCASVANADLAGSIAASKLVGTDIVTVGTLTAGATGAGFTVALGTSTITGILGAANGGTGNGFTAFTGPTTSTKTFTLPDASSTIATGTGTLNIVPRWSGTGGTLVDTAPTLTFDGTNAVLGSGYLQVPGLGIGVAGVSGQIAMGTTAGLISRAASEVTVSDASTGFGRFNLGTDAVATGANQRARQTTDYLLIGQGGAYAEANRSAIRWTASGVAAPSGVNADSNGDRLVFFNGPTVKFAMGMDSSAVYSLWLQSIADANNPAAISFLTGSSPSSALSGSWSVTRGSLHGWSAFTDTSNYERWTLSTTAGSGTTLAAETAGTGADNLELLLTSAGTSGVRSTNGPFSLGAIAYATAPIGTVASGTGVTVNGTAGVRRTTHSATFTYAAFAAAATTADKTIYTLAAKQRLVGIIADVTATFTGGAVSDADMTCGKTAGGSAYLVSFDVDTATSTVGLADADLGTSINRASAIQGGDMPSWTATTAITCRLTTVGANTDALTAGSVTFYLTLEMM